jgi:hypothetical protein
MASAMAMQQSGIASIAARVERGYASDFGVARPSRAGRNLKVKACPISFGWLGERGFVPRIQTLRRPFFSSTVVTVAMETERRASIIDGSHIMNGSSLENWPGRYPGIRGRQDRVGLPAAETAGMGFV